jgi:uncharacterized membrane protein YadS
MAKIDWSSLWRKEDWWACWIGWFILVLALIGILPSWYKIGKWTTLGQAFPDVGATLVTTVGAFVFVLVLTGIGLAFMKRLSAAYIPAFIVIFALAFLAFFLGKLNTKALWGVTGVPYVIWAIVLGLLISNLLGVPKWLKAGVMTEYFIKIGLVCMGAAIFFSDVIKAGAVGMGQALLVVGGVWFFAYWLGRRFGMSERFSGVMATGVSICGVSASIAAGGALKGDPKEVTYMIAWIMVCAVVLIIIMPPIALVMGLPANMAGAWIGGVIDNTGAVAAAGAVYPGEAAVTVALIVKMAQNVLIGFAAFFMALWATMSLDRTPGMGRPSLAEVWWRFPKFIVGFVVASLFVFLVLEPIMGAKEGKAIGKLAKTFRDPFFVLAFVCIGLETNFKDLVSVGGGKPAIAYWLAQTMNAFWTLLIVWILWSGWLFTPPI